MNDDLEELLKTAYVFIAMRHKAHQPWRKELDEWQAQIEALTGWDAYTTIREHQQKDKNEPA